ncbi:hypothetical protein CR513_16519, partial [Mucuna pruriens]
MIARTKIDVHAGILLMEFEDNLLQFNIFEVMKHPTEHHSIFNIDIIDELVEEYMQIGTGNADFSNLSDSDNNIADIADIVHIFEFSYLTDLLCKTTNCQHQKASPIGNNGGSQVQFRQPSPKADEAKSDYRDKKGAESDSTHKKGVEFDSKDKKLAKFNSRDKKRAETDSNNREEAKIDSNILKEAKINSNNREEAETDSNIQEEQFPVIIANNLHQEQEEKLLKVLRKHKKAIGWTGSPTYKAAVEMTESDHPRCSEERSDETTCSRDHLSHFG